jgi:hypothetical protein
MFNTSDLDASTVFGELARLEAIKWERELLRRKLNDECELMKKAKELWLELRVISPLGIV